MRRFIRASVLLLCGSLGPGLWAQNANSSVQGTVADVQGAVVSGAAISLTNVGTGQVLNTTSKADGFYSFVNLSPAAYKVTATASGFASWTGDITLRVSQQAEVNPKLAVASVATQIDVKDATPVIERVDPTISDVKDSVAIEAIPVQNRNILNVLAFSPGVVAGGYGGSGAGNTRVNGIAGGSMDYLVDGQTMSNKFTNELQSNPQSTMTFEEVKIMTAQGSAEYSRPGLVELVTKSGTNQFHGQAYELNRNNHLQARSFNSGPQIPFLQHNEWGAQLGGPVWLPKLYNGKNKTFFFFDYEQIQENSNATEQYVVPTMAERQGNLSDVLDPNGNPVQLYDPSSTKFDPATGAYTRTAFAGNILPSSVLNTVTQKVFGQTSVAGLSPLPEPNVPGANTWEGEPNYIPTAARAQIRNKLFTAKVDQLFGQNRLAGRYSYTGSTTLSPRSYAPTEPDLGSSGGHNGSLVFTEVFTPKLLNVLHVGVQYNHNYTGPQPIANVPELLNLPNYTGTIGWPSFYWDGNNDYYWVGIDRDNPKDYPDSTVTGSDQLSWNRGNHQMKYGFEVSNSRLTTSEIGQPGGGYNYSGYFTGLQDSTQTATGTYNVAVPDTGLGLADFLLGQTDSVNLNIYPVYHTRQTEYSGYAQDEWRASRKLTLNVGVRYEYWTPFSDASGLYSTFNPNVPGGMVVYAGSGALPAQTSQAVLNSFIAAGLPIESASTAGYPSRLFTMPKNNWEPRLGLAYQLGDKTVIRGGWGVYQWVIPLQQFQQASRKNPPFSYSSSLGPGQVNGVSTSSGAAELEFPIASQDYAGPQPLSQFQLGSSSLVLNTSNLSITQGSGFGIAPMDPNYKPSTVQEYSLTFARELPWQTGIEISYIGNNSKHLLQLDPINYTVPRTNCAAAGSTNVAQCQSGNAYYQRAYSVFGTSGGGNQELYEYNGYGNTNELQVRGQHTFGSGLMVQSYFTYARTLTTSEAGLLGTLAPGGQADTQSMIPAALTPGYSLTNPLSSGDSQASRLQAVYANDPTLPVKTFQFNAHYELPFGRDKKFLSNAHGIVNALVSGYNIAPFFLWHSGFYFAPYYSQFASSTVGSSGRGIMLAPGKTGILPKGQRTTQHWFDYSVWDPLAGAAYNGQTYELTNTALEGDFRNNIPLNYMTGPGFNNMDANVYKITPLGKGVVFDFEAQAFNIYNHQNLGMPNNHGIITAPIGSTRTIQLQAKFKF